MSAPLPPIHFVYADLTIWRDVEAGAVFSPDEAPQRFAGGINTWIVQTFLRLKLAGWNVTLGETPRSDAVCVVHFDHLLHLKTPWQFYLVAVRADRSPVVAAQQVVVQNQSTGDPAHEAARPSQASEIAPPSTFINFWPQPGVRERAADRQPRVNRLVFMGRPNNLATSLQTPEFAQAVQNEGAEFSIQTEAWYDYRNIDATLALRDGNPVAWSVKPASKLVNSWAAGCPALLGDESAFRALRRSELDYLPIDGPESVLQAVRRLNAQPQLYQAMVENGWERARQHNAATVLAEWTRFLSEQVAPDFAAWQKPSLLRNWQRKRRYQAQVQLENQLRREFKAAAWNQTN